METNVKLLGFSNKSFNGIPIDKSGFDLEYDGHYLDVNAFNNNSVYYKRLNNNDLMKLLNRPTSSSPLEERIANANYYSPPIEIDDYPIDIDNEAPDSPLYSFKLQKALPNSLSISSLNPKTLTIISNKSFKKPTSLTKKNTHKKRVVIKSPSLSHTKSKKATKNILKKSIKTSLKKTTKKNQTYATTTPQKKSIKKTSHMSFDPSPRSIQNTIY